MDFTAMKTDMRARNDFLEELAREYRTSIAYTARVALGRRATPDIVRNEATQAFLLAANRAIDTARTADDGRGKNDPRKWCKLRGLLGILDYFRRGEWGTRNRHHRFDRMILTSTLTQEWEGDESTLPIFTDETNYEERIVSHLHLQEILTNLEPCDRAIVELLVYGQTGFQRMRTSGRYGAARYNLAADLARTLGRSQSAIHRRMERLRQVFADAV